MNLLETKTEFQIVSHPKFSCICNHYPFVKKESLQKHLIKNQCSPAKTQEEIYNYLSKIKNRNWKGESVIEVIKKLTDEEKYDLSSICNPLTFYNCSKKQNFHDMINNLKTYYYDGNKYKWLCQEFVDTFKVIIFISRIDKNRIMVKHEDSADNRITINTYSWTTLLSNIFEKFIEEIQNENKVLNGPDIGEKQGQHTFFKKVNKYKLDSYAQFKQHMKTLLKPMLIKECCDKYFLDKSYFLTTVDILKNKKV